MESKEAYFYLTDITVSRLVLGPQAKALCSGKQLFMMTSPTGRLAYGLTTLIYVKIY